MDAKDQTIEKIVDRSTAIFLIIGFAMIGFMVGVSI